MFDNSKSTGILLSILCLLLLAPGCSAPPEEPQPGKPPILERVSPGDIPPFQDDMDSRSLLDAVERSLSYYGRVPANQTLSFGDGQISVESLKASLLAFKELLRSGRLDRETVSRRFDVYRSLGAPATGKILVTGYYEPILEGRLESDEVFRYPLYTVPPDLLTVELKKFDPNRFSDERLIGRVEGGRVVPYFTRTEIDGQGKLASCDCRMVWLKDRVAAFFLHIQGSGIIELPGGRTRRVGFAGKNGRPYRSIGKYLQDRGLVAPEAMSMQAIRTFLTEHPEMVDEVLGWNESYVFFRWVEEGPLGSLGVPLVAGRSIATDPACYPKGGLSFIQTDKPRLDASGQVTGWDRFGRWVLHQDTGGAIRGPGRVDLFCGTGEPAEATAGRMKQEGSLYFFLLKTEAQN